jgi:hypothetical protein
MTGGREMITDFLKLIDPDPVMAMAVIVASIICIFMIYDKCRSRGIVWFLSFGQFKKTEVKKTERKKTYRVRHIKNNRRL